MVSPAPPPEAHIAHLMGEPKGSASNRYFDDIIPLGESEVRDALLHEVKRHRYWKSSAFKKMQFERLSGLAIRARIAFTEARSTSEAAEAVNPGQLLDHATTSFTNPWDFECVAPAIEDVRVLEMPGSSTINPCSVCNSEGTYHCFHCRGLGTHDLCYMCHGRGVKECHHCKGGGKKPLYSLLWIWVSVRNYTKLKVYFKTERSEFFTQSEVPEKLLSQVKGREIFCEEQPYVLPITKYHVDEVNEKSKLFCAQHLQNSMGMCRVIQQRHCLVAIPVCKVYYTLGKTKGTFFVYGNERQCYVPSFPSKCVIL
ncbi:hypothetical protein OSTOST_08769 [Ostertagia ostertagi]